MRQIRGFILAYVVASFILLPLIGRWLRERSLPDLGDNPINGSVRHARPVAWAGQE